jgi:2-succinyl-6-hydroxy-2,4-cyclohexadiene-1-carboxylate synthase
MAFALHSTKRGRGPRVVLAHGFTQSSASFAPIASQLQRSFEVVSVDLPGHGISPVPPAGSDLHDTARALGQAGGRAFYVGYSLGGRCCMHLALDAPNLVERLVIVGAHPGIADGLARKLRRDADDALAVELERGGDKAVASFVDAWLRGPLFAHLSDEEADKPARLVNSAAGLAASLRTAGTGTQEPLWDRLGDLDMPVLVVVGARDDKFRPIAQRCAEAIGSNARLKLVEGAGHAACFERPREFVSLLEEFLAEAT